MAKKYRALKIAGQVTLGLGLGLVIAELAFSWRDEGAFPHANFYVADAELGVRLEPGATHEFQAAGEPADDDSRECSRLSRGRVGGAG
jgi:hypothetical protein